MDILDSEPEISIILPCRNEEEALGECLTNIKKTVKENNLDAEIIVSDSSTDSSPEIAKSQGVILVKHDLDGYGNAYLEAFKHAKGRFIFMADADCTYDFNEISRFITCLKEGSDFVVGDRLGGNIEKGAMSLSHRYLGNPILSSTLRLFFKTKIHDAHCGMRAVRKDVLDKLNLQAKGMEFASEMIVKALKNNLRIKEVPICYYARKGKSKMKSFRDAWRHFRFMLLFSPFWLFFVPGFFLFLIGLISMVWLLIRPATVFGFTFYNYPIFISSLLLIIGYQIIIFAFFAKSYAIVHLGERSHFVETLNRHITLERGGLIGIILTVCGLCIFGIVLSKWINGNFGFIDEIKNAVSALTLAVMGVQTIFSSFMLSIIGIKK